MHYLAYANSMCATRQPAFLSPDAWLLTPDSCLPGIIMHVTSRAMKQARAAKPAARDTDAYLRALGSKVPNIYGPSADAEPAAAG